MSTGRSSSRPPVTVVMPFTGTVETAHAALQTLGALSLKDRDELILADNCGVALGLDQGRPAGSAPVRVIDARGERSPAHARNAGAAVAGSQAEWILFLDADTVAPRELLQRYFAVPIADDVGAISGAITAAPLGRSAGVVARYGAHKNFLDAGAHLTHPFLPRAAAANLLVRRAAFDGVGGFFEGLRAAEDTDFSWRLQRAGWVLISCPAAAVEHRYRDSLGELRRQWRGYAAGRAWLGRRYDGFAPQPALARAARRTRPGEDDRRVTAVTPPRSVAARDRPRFAALDVILGVEELVGLALSNRPGGTLRGQPSSGRVLVADRFPVEPAAPLTDTVSPASTRIEAGARAERAADAASAVTIIYREDDGLLDRARALVTLLARRPVGVLTVTVHDAAATVALAPAACRLLAEPDATVAPSSADPVVQAATRQLRRLVGREPAGG